MVALELLIFEIWLALGVVDRGQNLTDLSDCEELWSLTTGTIRLKRDCRGLITNTQIRLADLLLSTLDSDR